MENVRAIFNKPRKINLILFCFSFSIYFLYFHPVFLNINSILSSITLDSLKNYYTFVYHIKNDESALHFSGMNFPFGEHIIYTDCQPIFALILKLLPFTHDYLIGIMHTLIFFSFIITPVILNKILRLFDIDAFSAFFISLAIALLSPQFVKINGGHFALAYGCLIPLSILFIVNYLKERTIKKLLILFFFNTFLFLLHPYLGLCLSLFSFFAIVFFTLSQLRKEPVLKPVLLSFIPGLFPPVFFKVFTSLTDYHINRTVEPFGAEMMVENLDSLLSPVFGPFQPFLETLFPNRAFHFEGHSYIGFFTILLSVFFLCLLLFRFKKLVFKKEVSVLFFASLLFLLISFGLHLKLLHYFHIQSASVNQFRAVCRFAWIFYFTLPLFLIVGIYQYLQQTVKPKTLRTLIRSGSILFFLFNLAEAHSFFSYDPSVFWNYANFFRKDLLKQEQKDALKSIAERNPQAIIPLPLFHGGSEMYDRTGSNNSMIPSMIYSYHSNTPILSGLLSRTSISETENMIGLLNSYKTEKQAAAYLNAGDFLVLTTNDLMLPDETRLMTHVTNFAENDSLKTGFISRQDFLARKLAAQRYQFLENKQHLPDPNNVLFIPNESRKPFTGANINDYEKIFTLDSNMIKTGNYVVSFHYHYTQKVYRALACNLIVTRSNKKSTEWRYNIPVRYLSGFYSGYGVFEYKLELTQNNAYEFMLKGFEDQTYRISDFMLRPEETDVWVVTGKDTVVNNFPKN